VASAGSNAIPFRSRGRESNAQIGRLSWRRRAIVRLAKRQVHTAAGNLKAVLEQDAL